MLLYLMKLNALGICSKLQISCIENVVTQNSMLQNQNF